MSQATTKTGELICAECDIGWPERHCTLFVHIVDGELVAYGPICPACWEKHDRQSLRDAATVWAMKERLASAN